MVELLAATDKDNFTPIGGATWPSFTRVLIDQITKMMVDDESCVLIPELHRQMLRAESGLRKQPFYVCMTSGGTPGTIKLSRWNSKGTEGTQSITTLFPNESFLDLRLRLFKPLDSDSAQSFLKWTTRDSPAFIKDVEIMDDILRQAKAANELGLELIHSSHQPTGPLLPFLSREGQDRARELFDALRQSMLAPSSGPLGDIEAIRVVNELRQKSDALLSFVDDCVATLDADMLNSLKRKDLAKARDLRDRILMRLTLIEDAASRQQPIRVEFEDPSQATQRLRVGKRQGTPVLVEYIYYDSVESESFSKISRQVARISALHADKKSPAFHTLHGVGFSHEILHGPRFGMIYATPEGKAGCQFRQLSELLGQVKVVPLEVRYELGQAVCEGLLGMHSVGWFHKAIKSDNILIYSASQSGDEDMSLHASWDFKNPYIIGFDCSRPENAETYSTIDFNTANNIYRHPDRWGKSQRFERHHDLYPLVCTPDICSLPSRILETDELMKKKGNCPRRNWLLEDVPQHGQQTEQFPVNQRSREAA